MIVTSLTFIVGLLILIRAFLNDRYIRLLNMDEVLKFYRFINQNSPKKNSYSLYIPDYQALFKEIGREEDQCATA